MIKAVIFDMDGVLVDSEPANLKQLKGFMEMYGVTSDEAFLTTLVGSSYDFTCLECARVMEKDWTVAEFTEKFNVYVKNHQYSYGDVLNPHVKEILLWLREKGYKTAVASSSFLSQIDDMETICNLKGCFDELVSGEMFKESKPHPEIYLHTASALGLATSECLAIEDSSYGIEAAKAAGMQVVAYRDERYGVDQSQAHHIIDGMLDLKAMLA